MALPSGYKQLEYIRSTGTQYIDTKFVPNQNTRVVFDGIVNTASSGSAYGFGVRTSGWSNAIAAGATKEGYLQCGYANASNSSTVAAGARCTIDIDCGLFKITQNGTVVYSYDFGSKTFTSPGNLYLFTLNNNGSIYNSASATLYSFKVYDNGTLVRDFIPCKNASGTVGLWDDVNSVFYENKGSGTFIAGSEIVPDDPLAPYDGHNTNVGNVARKIDTGDVLHSGVSREIESGLVLVNGVVREIDFVGTVPVSITGSGDANGLYTHVIYDGVKYVPVTEIQVPIGGVIDCYLSTAGWAFARSGIYLNGVEKYRAGYGTTYTYYHTITGPTTINIRGNASGGYGEIFITEE